MPWMPWWTHCACKPSPSARGRPGSRAGQVEAGPRRTMATSGALKIDWGILAPELSNGRLTSNREASGELGSDWWWWAAW
jgi:hypothetical protein